jgi:hypothetical protein
MERSLLDTDIFSEVLKRKDPNVARNASAYRQLAKLKVRGRRCQRRRAVRMQADAGSVRHINF